MRIDTLLQFDVASQDQAQKVMQDVMQAFHANAVQVIMLPCVDGEAQAAVVTARAQVGQTVVYTDGGCDHRRGGVGAWAYLAHLPNGHVRQRVEGMVGTTNNRMEMLAVIRALEELEIGPPIRVVSDSEYVIKGVTEWSAGWVRNGWLTKDGNPVKNRDLWETLVGLYTLHDATFEHVKGHSGHQFNEHVDQLCAKEMQELHKKALLGMAAAVDTGLGK
jgi:ribonuclease HI